MRIAHVITYVSADGAFGGPIAVARAQAEELARRGHDVHILAGWDGVAELSVPGVTVHLFKVRRLAKGLTGLIAPGLGAYLRQSKQGFDVIHVHLGRDIVSAPAAILSSRVAKRVVLQPHGMIASDPRVHARIFDAIFTKRIFRSAHRILALTDTELQSLRAVAGGQQKIDRIDNGVRWDPHFDRPSPGDTAVVVFLARLHPRKRVLDFAEAAQILVEKGTQAEFRVFGPDEGDLERLQEIIASNAQLASRLSYNGALSPGMGVAELAKADIYVLPSVGEVFPMTVLESISVGTPPILTKDCGISDELARRGAAVVVDPGAKSMADAIDDLLKSEERRDAIKRAGRVALTEWIGIEAVVDRLEESYL